jgi:ABC-2 type transport system permease protein
MAFLSGSFMPMDMLPSWLETGSRILPLRYLNDAASAALSGRGDMGDVVLGCGGLLAFTVIFGAVSLKTFRWSNKA